MSFGVRIKNPSDAITLDSNFLNYVSVGSGSQTISVGTTVGSTVISFPGASSSMAAPLVAAKWTENNNVYCFGIRGVGSTGNWTGFEVFFASVGSATSITFTWKAFDSNRQSGQSFGLRVFSEDSKVVFDSGMSPMEIAGYIGPGNWTAVSNTVPVQGVRRMVFQQTNPVAASSMVLSCNRYGDLAYPNGVEGQAPVALVSYCYGYGTGGTLRLLVILQTFSPTVNPSSLSTPNAYIAPLVIQ